MDVSKVKMMNNLINETSIGTASQKITVSIEIDKTAHAGDRQSRHGESNPITDDEIRKTAERGIPKLSKLLLLDKIRVGDDVVIQAGGGMNVVGNIQKHGDELKLVVITVMKKKNFKPKAGTTPIKV